MREKKSRAAEQKIKLVGQHATFFKLRQCRAQRSLIKHPLSVIFSLFLASCSSNFSDSEELPPGVSHLPIDEEEWYRGLVAWEKEHGPVGQHPDQIISFNDELFEEPNQSSVIQKVRTPLVFGYAVHGINVRQDGDLNDHCTIFDKPCDDQVHRQASSLNYHGEFGAASGNIFARCGNAVIGGAAFAPCIVPRATTKSWTWNYVESSCPDNVGAGHALINNAAQEMFQKLENTTNWTFTETASLSPNILIECRSRIPSNLMAVGFPDGELELDYAADHIFYSVCNEPGQALLVAYTFSDMYYTYNKGRIALNWDTLWETLLGCDGDPRENVDRLKSVMIHEIGHVLGLVHANSPVDNWMSSAQSCETLSTSWQRDVDNYTDAWSWLDHSDRSSLQVLDTEITCRQPYHGY